VAVVGWRLMDGKARLLLISRDVVILGAKTIDPVVSDALTLSSTTSQYICHSNAADLRKIIRFTPPVR
jgi:hypothetical protein